MKRLGIDTELLVLLAVGRENPQYIQRHDNLGGYSISDFNLLEDIISQFNVIVVTPHVLTETSNLISQIGEPLKKMLRQRLGTLIKELTESDVSSKTGALRPEMAYVGLTDAVWLCLKDEIDSLILNEKRGLMVEAYKAGISVIHFDQERENTRTQ